jgi:glycosyltransferase involved in cell wall biosynthesis
MISATIITLNEEKNIRDCLESLKWADEIIVSDTGSTDKTVEICQKFGARVFIDEWLGFGAQKNLCQERASSEWILNVDADERVTPELKEEILQAARNGARPGYFMPRKNFFGKRWIRHCGWYPDFNLRLYRKELGRFSEKRVHESVVLDEEAGYLKSPLIHLTYKDVADYLDRMQRYSTLAAEEMYANGKSAGLADLFFRPAFTFFKMLVLQRGFLDGTSGVVLSGLYACYTFAKYAKLREMRTGGGAGGRGQGAGQMKNLSHKEGSGGGIQA